MAKKNTNKKPAGAVPASDEIRPKSKRGASAGKKSKPKPPPAPKGNQWWRNRTKHGRDKLFSSPDILWEECCKYFEATDKRKWVEKDWVGKDAKAVERKTDTPYTLSGLFLFLNIDQNTWARYRKDEPYRDFWEIVSRVDQIIYTQKFEGAVVGAYNANIIARDLGLTDKKD